MQLLGEEIDFKGNLLYSFKRYRVWWVILLVTMVFDYLTTLNFVEVYGPKSEANLVIRWLIINTDVYIGTAFGKLLQLVSVMVMVSLKRRLGNLFMLVVILLNCWAVVINVL